MSGLLWFVIGLGVGLMIPFAIRQLVMMRKKPAATAPAFDPTTISGIKLWLRADLGVTKDGSNKVSTWADQSGNGNNVTQGTGARQPTWTAADLNGRDVITFSGAQDLLSAAISPNIVDATKKGTYFIIAKHATGNPTTDCLFSAADSNGDFCRYGITGGTMYMRSLDPVLTNNYAFGTSWKLISLIYNNTTSASAVVNHRVNGVTLATTATGLRVTPQTKFAIGTNVNTSGTPYAGYSLNGKIAEFIYFAAVLADSDRDAVESYLMTRYGLS